jgi:imidazolonepropionase-like amidohydrolase
VNDERQDKSQLLAVRGSHVLDVESGELSDRNVVVIRDSRVVSVEATVPADARLIDLPDSILMPGLIDAHTHILLHGNKGAEEARYQLMEEYPAHRIAHAVQAMRISLDNGFTTIRDLGSEGVGYADVALRDAVAEGIIEGPRMLVAGPALSSTGTYPVQRYRPDWAFPAGVQVVDGADACRRAVREQISYGADWIKVYTNSGAGRTLNADGYIDSPPNWTAEELTAIVSEAHSRGTKVAAHATSDIGLDMALAAGVDSIEHGYSIRPAAAKLMAERGVYLSPTMLAADYVIEHRARERGPIWQAIRDVQARTLRNCLDAGVKIAFGTDVGGFPWTEFNQAEEMPFLERIGMSATDIIRSATTVAAELLGLASEVGTLRPGASADIIAVKGDPRSDLTRLASIDFVMRAGQVVRSPRAY